MKHGEAVLGSGAQALDFEFTAPGSEEVKKSGFSIARVRAGGFSELLGRALRVEHVVAYLKGHAERVAEIACSGKMKAATPI